MQKCDGNLVAVSLSLHAFDGLVVLGAVVLLVVEGEGFLALVGGLLVGLLLLVHQWKIYELGEAFVAVEDALVAFAAWGDGYISDRKKESYSLHSSISYKIWCLAFLCYLGAGYCFCSGCGYALGCGSFLRKWRISGGVSGVKDYCLRVSARSCSALETAVMPFLRFFLRSFSILCSLRKNFWAWERTCEVVRV